MIFSKCDFKMAGHSPRLFLCIYGLLDQDQGHYKYPAIVTTQAWEIENL